MFGVCINNYYWFGTLGKSYEILDIKKKILKGIKYKNDDFEIFTFTVKDDNGNLVNICSDKFIFKEK